MGLLGLAVLVPAATAGSSPRGHESGRGKTVVITGGVKHLRFKAPNRVRAGAQLRIVNRTNPIKVGPHTFSIVRKGQLPPNRRKQQRCFRKGNVCRAIAVAHKFDPQTGKVNKNPVDPGHNGWGRAFSKRHIGDSWYTQGKNQKFSQRVSFRPGRKFRVLCAIHPFMQGKIRVVGG